MYSYIKKSKLNVYYDAPIKYLRNEKLIKIKNYKFDSFVIHIEKYLLSIRIWYACGFSILPLMESLPLTNYLYFIGTSKAKLAM